MSGVLDPVPWLIGRFVLAALFFAAAMHKLRDRSGFRQSVRGYGLLPQSLIAVVARALPATELAVAIGLLLPQPIGSAAAIVAAVLLVGYAAAVGVNLVRGRRDVDCGCGGPAGRQTIHAGLVVRNVVVAVVAFAVAGSPSERGLTWLDGFTVGCATLCLVLLWISIDYLFVNRRRFGLAVLSADSSPTVLAPSRS